MSIAETIYSVLSANTGLAALVGTRIYPVSAPQSVVFPYIVYSRISNVPDMVRGEAAPIRNHTYQVSIFAKSFSETESIGTEVFGSLDYYREGTLWMYYDNDVDLYEEDIRVYQRAIDFIVREAVVSTN
jgi:hypothetical protein